MVGGRNLKLLIALKTKQVDSSKMFYTCLHVWEWVRTGRDLVSVTSPINSAHILVCCQRQRHCQVQKLVLLPELNGREGMK